MQQSIVGSEQAGLSLQETNSILQYFQNEILSYDYSMAKCCIFFSSGTEWAVRERLQTVLYFYTSLLMKMPGMQLLCVLHSHILVRPISAGLSWSHPEHHPHCFLSTSKLFTVEEVTFFFLVDGMAWHDFFCSGLLGRHFGLRIMQFSCCLLSCHPPQRLAFHIILAQLLLTFVSTSVNMFLFNGSHQLQHFSFRCHAFHCRA